MKLVFSNDESITQNLQLHDSSWTFFLLHLKNLSNDTNFLIMFGLYITHIFRWMSLICFGTNISYITLMLMELKYDAYNNRYGKFLDNAILWCNNAFAPKTKTYVACQWTSNIMLQNDIFFKMPFAAMFFIIRNNLPNLIFNLF